MTIILWLLPSQQLLSDNTVEHTQISKKEIKSFLLLPWLHCEAHGILVPTSYQTHAPCSGSTVLTTNCQGNPDMSVLEIMNYNEIY